VLGKDGDQAADGDDTASRMINLIIIMRVV
jgi:hypothetical protein